MASWLKGQGRPGGCVTLTGAAADAGQIESFAEAGVERVTFALPTAPVAETLCHLEALAAFTGRRP